MRRMGVAAARTRFAGASALLREPAGPAIAPRTVQRHTEALGRGVAADGSRRFEPEPLTLSNGRAAVSQVGPAGPPCTASPASVAPAVRPRMSPGRAVLIQRRSQRPTPPLCPTPPVRDLCVSSDTSPNTADALAAG